MKPGGKEDAYEEKLFQNQLAFQALKQLRPCEGIGERT